MTFVITHAEEKEIEMAEAVGFSTIPDQFRHKSIEDGFILNLLVIGRRGLGTTTLVNSIFNAPLLERSRSNDIEVSKNEIYENKIKLTVVITTYHGTDTDQIINYIQEKNLEYYCNENGLRVNYHDNRIHACVYLVPIDEIRQEELTMIKKISKKCNFIPIIPKADIFTPEEMIIFKQNILEKLKNNDVRIYWPISNEEDEELHKEANNLISKYPLCTAASETIYEHKGEFFRGRKYKWGFVNVCNPEVSEFLDLRRMLVHSFLDDIIFQTETVFYEAYKGKCMNDRVLAQKIEKNLIEQVKQEAMNLYAKDLQEQKADEVEIEMVTNKIDELQAGD